MTTDEKQKICEIPFDPDELNQYCSKLFQFETNIVKRFKEWSNFRGYQREKKSSVPRDATVVSFSASDLPSGADYVTRKTDFHLNPKNKTFLCILHEYIQWAFKSPPVYTFSENTNGNAPFSASVQIEGIVYANGTGTSKRMAKNYAARKTLAILLPKVYPTLEKLALPTHSMKPLFDEANISFFDDILIEDSRLDNLCKKAGQVSPHNILMQCIRRNLGLGDPNVEVTARSQNFKVTEFTMVVGSHSVTVTSRNKREAKQLLAQAALKKMHPHLTYFGSLLRLYCDTNTEQMMEEKNILKMQHTKKKSTDTEFPILKQLREHMLRLYGNADKPARAVPKFQIDPSQLPILPLSPPEPDTP